MGSILLRALLFGGLVYFTTNFLFDGQFTAHDVVSIVILAVLITNEIVMKKSKPRS